MLWSEWHSTDYPGSAVRIEVSWWALGVKRGEQWQKGPEGCQQSCIWGKEVEEDWCGCRSGLRPIAF